MPDPNDPTGLTGPTEELESDLSEEEMAEVQALAARMSDEGYMQLPDGGKLTSKDFRELAQYCNTLTQTMLQMFTSFQDLFKNGAISFMRMAEFLEKDADAMKKVERDSRTGPRDTTIENDPTITNVENVFNTDQPKPTLKDI